jgi:hypothetical protein
MVTLPCSVPSGPFFLTPCSCPHDCSPKSDPLPKSGWKGPVVRF